MEQHFIKLNLEPILHENIFVAVWVYIDPDGVYWELAGAETPELTALKALFEQYYSRVIKALIHESLTKESV